jgi:hypothetical protein
MSEDEKLLNDIKNWPAWENGIHPAVREQIERYKGEKSMTDEMINEELNDEELNDEEERENALEDLFDEEYDDEEEEEVPVSKVITEIAQPVKITTSVGAEIDSKGQLKPNCKFTIERNITADDDEYEIMETDFDALIEKVKETIFRLKGEN